MFGWLRRKQDTKPLATSVMLDGERVRLLAQGVETESFGWDEIETVRAWKQDCFGVDRIWVAFIPADIEACVCVNEETEGYQALIDEMQRRCEGYLADWWSKVAFPAFAENHTVIWRRSNGAV